MKIAVIGGGSTYTPELVDGMLVHGAGLGLARLTLHDIDDARLAVVGDFARRMVRHAGARFAVETTGDLDHAVGGADFVITQIRVGGQAARHEDIMLGLRHGLIGQETTGVGGFAKAMRTIPVLRRVLDRVQALAPAAWLLNFTNPAGLVTEALHRLGCSRLVGLCNIPAGMQMDIAKALGVDGARVELDYVGANHLAWVRGVRLDGIDILPRIIDVVEADNAVGRPANIEDMDYPAGFIRDLGALPSPYLRYFYLTAQMLADLKAKPKSRAQEVAEIESELLAVYRDPNVVEKPAALGKRGGAYYSKVAVELIRSIAHNRRDIHIVNVPNGRAVEGLGADQTVEVPCVVGAAGVTPLPQRPVEPAYFGLLAQVKAYETLTAEAAIEGSRRKALLALVNQPLCTPEKAPAVLDDAVRTFGLDLR